MNPIRPLDVDSLVATDEAMIRLLRDGQAEAALAGIQQRYGERIRHFVHGIVRDEHLAHDIVQEVFEKLLVKNHLYQEGTNFRAWLFEVARNQALSALQSPREDQLTCLRSATTSKASPALMRTRSSRGV